MRLTVNRTTRTARSTMGELLIDGIRHCYTLEDPVRPPGIKLPGMTAIPAGVYPVQITYSPKFQRRMPLLVGVPNFSGVRIHSGNRPEDTEGCILVGYDQRPDFIGQSRAAFDVLYAALASALGRDEACVIEVIDAWVDA